MWALNLQLPGDRIGKGWAVTLNRAELPINDELGMCPGICTGALKRRCAAVSSTHPSPRQKTKRETSDAQKVSLSKQDEIGQFWNLAEKINATSIIIFETFFVIFLWSHDLGKWHHNEEGNKQQIDRKQRRVCT